MQNGVLVQEGGLMLKAAIGIGIGGFAALIGAGLYILRRPRSHQFVSTSEWVKLMRENNARILAKEISDKRRRPEGRA